MPKDDAHKISLETGMLSFARSMQPSEGLFWGTRSKDAAWRQPIEVREKGVRGQSSGAKTDKPGESNPQVVEAASVPLGCDGVNLEFTMWVAPFALKPWACGNADVGNAYERLVGSYAEKGGFDVLARLYLWNMANARFAWRNRFLSDEMRVAIAFDGDTVDFDPTRLKLEVPASLDDLRAAVLSNEPEARGTVDKLARRIADGLGKAHGKMFMRVAWRAQVQEAQEVFPSQEYLRDEIREKAPSRVYAKLPRFFEGREVQQASMHGQKIGAALRHIDIWHGDETYQAIAVNPYGGIQETGDVLRKPKTGRSFYELRAKAAHLLSAVDSAKAADDLPGEVHFVVANLVRGGVFGQKGGTDV